MTLVYDIKVPLKPVSCCTEAFLSMGFFYPTPRTPQSFLPFLPSVNGQLLRHQIWTQAGQILGVLYTDVSHNQLLQHQPHHSEPAACSPSCQSCFTMGRAPCRQINHLSTNFTTSCMALTPAHRCQGSAPPLLSQDSTQEHISEQPECSQERQQPEKRNPWEQRAEPPSASGEI